MKSRTRERILDSIICFELYSKYVHHLSYSCLCLYKHKPLHKPMQTEMLDYIHLLVTFSIDETADTAIY